METWIWFLVGAAAQATTNALLTEMGIIKLSAGQQLLAGVSIFALAGVLLGMRWMC